jgi:hypothetical protein
MIGQLGMPVGRAGKVSTHPFAMIACIVVEKKKVVG